GMADVIVAGGVEHLGHMPMVDPFDGPAGAAWPPDLVERWHLANQGVGAERIAEKWDISREEMDELALKSHHRAAQATEEGRFEREILPFRVNGSIFSKDEGIRPDTSLEKLATLKPVFK